MPARCATAFHGSMPTKPSQTGAPRTLHPGHLAVLEDGERRPLGLATVNPNSKIIGRVLDRDPEAVIDKAWFAARISAKRIGRCETGFMMRRFIRWSMPRQTAFRGW